MRIPNGHSPRPHPCSARLPQDSRNTQITIRIIPVVADTQVAPSFVGTTPTPLVVPPVVPVTPIASSGGGCTAGTGQAPFDPVLPMLAALGLVGLVLRRLRRH